jgi:hypothetical protein
VRQEAHLHVGRLSLDDARHRQSRRLGRRFDALWVAAAPRLRRGAVVAGDAARGGIDELLADTSASQSKAMPGLRDSISRRTSGSNGTRPTRTPPGERKA